MIYNNTTELVSAIADSVARTHPPETRDTSAMTGSTYMTYEDKDGDEFVIRISDHKRNPQYTDGNSQSFNVNDMDIQPHDWGIQVTPDEFRKFAARIRRCVEGKHNCTDTVRKSKQQGKQQ